MSIAKVINGEILEIRSMEMEDVPFHKRYLWKPVIDSPPVVNNQIERLRTLAPGITANGSHVEIRYTVQSLPVPQVVTAFQAKMALVQAQLYDNIVAAIESENDTSLKVAWETATTFERNSQFILAMQPKLGLTDQDIDNLFWQASFING